MSDSTAVTAAQSRAINAAVNALLGPRMAQLDALLARVSATVEATDFDRWENEVDSP